MQYDGRQRRRVEGRNSDIRKMSLFIVGQRPRILQRELKVCVSFIVERGWLGEFVTKCVCLGKKMEKYFVKKIKIRG